jgi:hypothetical protein
MDVLTDIENVMKDFGLPSRDVERLMRGFRLQLELMAIRDALGRTLTRREREDVRAKLARGTSISAIVDSLR